MGEKNLRKRKKIALVAHDNMKKPLIAWARENKEILRGHSLCGTGTTAKMIGQETGLEVEGFKSGPLGGDQQLGARIADLDIDILIFFWDPLEAQPHDPDVKALLRIAVLYNIPIGNNKSTADFILTSPYMEEDYERSLEDYERLKNSLNRRL